MTTCPITYQPFVFEDTSACMFDHRFERIAIADWLRTHQECPVCLQKVPKTQFKELVVRCVRSAGPSIRPFHPIHSTLREFKTQHIPLTLLGAFGLLIITPTLSPNVREKFCLIALIPIVFFTAVLFFRAKTRFDNLRQSQFRMLCEQQLT